MFRSLNMTAAHPICTDSCPHPLLKGKRFHIWMLEGSVVEWIISHQRAKFESPHRFSTHFEVNNSLGYF